MVIIILFKGERRRIDKVLQEATKMFNNASRAGIPKLFVLITGGNQPLANGGRDLAEASKSLHDIGSTIYVINVNNPPATKQLLPMVENPRNVIPVKSFDTLPLLSSSIARQMAKATSMYPEFSLISKGFLICETSLAIFDSLTYIQSRNDLLTWFSGSFSSCTVFF